MEYECCVRTNRKKPIVWDEEGEWFSNAEGEELITAGSPEEAAEQYVQVFSTGLGDLYETYGGEVDHGGECSDDARIEVWVREAPVDDYSKPAWENRYMVRIRCNLEYEIVDAEAVKSEAC